MKSFYRFAAICAVSTLLTAPASADDAHVGLVTDYVKANVAGWLADPAIVEAIKAQNAAHAALTQGDIDALDGKWRAEVEASAKPTVDAALANGVSKFLTGKKNAAEGLITEVFVMDNKGLNVGLSDVTSDYWQGDEDKFQKSYGAGANAIFVDEIETDESTQTMQAQVSVTISDPASGAPIGAITLGIDVEKL